ncbi:transmembrane proteins 14C-domain-containing protein [Roridomyces roridus]|uniref:Transmembrane proteins 14C-domain-containing protein n=1 Tax=Roridomyces roridus TaxID=1738132 RepID=A0AAD7BSV4_9AGAR|nr:transmembrane proteins 14C-domain-containing protein [Roridomyces roridus]
MSEIPAFCMSALCIVGGGIGFYKKSSIPSLVAGLLVGMLYLFSGAQIAEGNPKGLQGAFFASALLTLSSAPRIKKGAMPKVLAVTASIMGFYYGRKLY